MKPLNTSRTIQKPSKSCRNELWGWNVRIWRLSTSCCWDSECVIERGIPNLESSSNPWKSFKKKCGGSRQGYNFLLIQSRRQRFLNATHLNNEFRNGTGVRISTQTVRNRLHEFGVGASRPAVCVPLMRQHVQDRLYLPELPSGGQFVTGHQFFSLMSPDSV